MSQDYERAESASGTNPLNTDSAKAWEELIESVGPAGLLVVIERRMSASLRRRLAAEDLLQETLMHAWRDRKAVQWRGLRSFRAWLLTIADNRIRDAATRESALKRGGDSPAIAFSAMPPESHSDPGIPSADALVDSATPSWIAAHKEHAGAIREALDRVPAELRDVIYLRLLEQHSAEETAARLGITPSAVRYRLRKGTEIYRNYLRAAIGSRTRATIPSSEAGADSAPS